MKKLLAIILALGMTLSFAACGEKETPAPAETPSSTANTDVPVPEDAPADEPAAEEELTFELDYENIASWLAVGFIGTSASGGPVVMGSDEKDENAVIIFGDNDTKTAASFVGAFTFAEDTATISDVANGTSLTFSLKKIDDSTLEIDMGEELGTATLKSAPKEDVLKAIKGAIDNYKHLA